MSLGRTAALAVPALLAFTLMAAGAGPAATPACTPSSTQVWLGVGLGGGTAGSTYYPLEFSNIGHHACSLSGYPGVSAYAGALHQVGQPAGRSAGSHASVTLAPGATAHAQLGVRDWGAVCTHAVAASGLKVYPPGQTHSWTVPFATQGCAGRSVLVIGPIRAGVGVPGYTTS